MTSVIADLPPNGNSDHSNHVVDPYPHSLVDEDCIPEEREEESEGSENNEPTTPIDLLHPSSSHITAAATTTTIPLLLDGNQSRKSLLKPLETSYSANISSPLAAASDQQQTLSPTTPTTPNSSVKRLSSIFRRSASQQMMQAAKVLDPQNGASETNLTRRIMGSRQRSATNSASASPFTTRSNTPPSPRSSTRNSLALNTDNEPQPGDIKKNRSSTGFTNFRQKIGFTHHGKTEGLGGGDTRKRATSVDLKNTIHGISDREITLENTTLGHRQPWALPAQYGTGSKARRLSLSLPDDFNIDVTELHDEYSDQSKLIGKRGKTVGKGATSKVSLMVRKGGSSHEVYAVKEFRGKSRMEDAEEYDNKIKSEYSISKSLHHPNIVETYRLCIDHGHWNHVMEYCEQGDLFNLVKQGHLQSPDRQPDRLCLFKQLIQGINYLHTNGIAHRDIKLENLLITSQREYDPRPLDVWSSAIVMLHIIFGGALWNRAKINDGQINYDKVVRGWEKFNNSSNNRAATEITETSYPYVDAFDKMIKPPALRRMLLGMLNPNPQKRFTIQEVAKKGWMKSVECCQVDSYDDPGVVIDASKSRNCPINGVNGVKGPNGYNAMKVVRHNHLPPAYSKGHSLFVRSAGSGGYGD